jgi:RNA polymerase sigma factor (sigma-70 family)
VTALDPVTEHVPAVSVESLYGQHYRALVKMAALMVDDRYLGEDIVQEAFAELVSRWSKVAPDLALHYLANRSRSVLRRRRTARAHRPERNPDEPGADASVLRAEGYNDVLVAIAALPARQRQIVVLRYYLGHSIAETAKVLDMTPAAVSTAANRAMSTLKKARENFR